MYNEIYKMVNFWQDLDFIGRSDGLKITSVAKIFI